MLIMVQYGNPELNGGGGWGIFNSLFGWQNSATYGSVISYNVYWIAIIIAFLLMRYKETKGHLPIVKAKAGSQHLDETTSHGLNNSDVEEHKASEVVGSIKVARVNSR